MGFSRRQPRQPGAWTAWAAGAVQNLLICLAAIFLLATATPLTLWWTSLLQGPSDSGVGQVMVVLAGSTMDGGLLGESSYWRCAFAVREASRGPYRRIILSGGAHSDPPAVVPMKQFLVSSGLPDTVMEMEGKSVSTHESSELTAQMLRGETRPIALVTSDYHMYRSAKLFEKAGIPVIRRPYPDTSARAKRWRNRFEIATELAVETTKIVYYKLRGWI